MKTKTNGAASPQDAERERFLGKKGVSKFEEVISRSAQTGQYRVKEKSGFKTVNLK